MDVCFSQGGDLVSIETEEEWQFIRNEIQQRGTGNSSAWHIGLKKNGWVWTWVSGLWKRDGVWIWNSGEQLNISKWRDSEPDGNEKKAEISKNGGLFNGIPWNQVPTFARFPKVRSQSNHKLDPVSRVTGIPEWYWIRGIKCSDTTRVGLVY